MHTITIFVSWVPLVLPLCGAVRRALGRLKFFCIWLALLASQVCATNRVLHQRVNERNLQVSSAGHVVETTNICGRFLCCLFTFATVVWVFTKRRTICFGEFCSPDEVGRFGKGSCCCWSRPTLSTLCRHLEVQFWLCSFVGRVTSICAVALQRNTKQKPSTNTT